MAALKECAVGRFELQAQLPAWVPPTGGCGSRARAASPPARLRLPPLRWLAGWRLGSEAESAPRCGCPIRVQHVAAAGRRPAAGRIPAGREKHSAARPSFPRDGRQRCDRKSPRRTGKAFCHGARGAVLPTRWEGRRRRNPPSATLCAVAVAIPAGCSAGLGAWCVCPGAQPSSRLVITAQSLLRGQPAGDFHSPQTA